jgi:small subunit ribosomal protein S24e
MKVNITSQQYNPLLKRKEVTFEIGHEETKGTPPRVEARKALAENLKANVDLVYVRKMQTKTGTMKAKGEANIYDSIEQAKLVEPQHVIERNVPSEKKAKDTKKTEEKPKPEKAGKVEKVEKAKEPEKAKETSVEKQEEKKLEKKEK